MYLTFVSFSQLFLSFLSSPSHDFIGDFTTSYRELARGQSQFNVYEVSNSRVWWFSCLLMRSGIPLLRLSWLTILIRVTFIPLISLLHCFLLLWHIPSCRYFPLLQLSCWKMYSIHFQCTSLKGTCVVEYLCVSPSFPKQLWIQLNVFCGPVVLILQQ